MKAKKSHDLLSASKRLRKVRDLVLVHLQRLENQDCGWWKSWSKGKRGPMSRSSKEEWISIPSSFVLFKPSTDWMIPPSPHWGVQSTLLIKCCMYSIQMLYVLKCWSYPEPVLLTHLEIMCYLSMPWCS